MPKSIGNRSAESIIDAIEENLVETSLSLGRSEEGVVFRGSDVTWVYTGYQALSRVLRARFEQPRAEDRVAEISDCFRQWDAPVLWVVGPSSWPPELPDLLCKSGFGNSELWTGMAVDLDALPQSPRRASSIRIEAVNEQDALAAWVTVSVEPWASGAAANASEIFAPANAGGDPLSRYYLAYLNGQPIARAMSYTRNGTAGLYWLARAKEYGDVESDVEFAIAHRVLVDARSNGATIAVMPSQSGESRVLEQLRFKPYCQFEVFAWPSTAPPKPFC